MQYAYFYLLTDDGPKTYHRAVCGLVEQLWHKGLNIYLNCDNIEVAQQLDDDLWTFKDTGFIPHHFITDASSVEHALPSCYIGYRNSDEPSFVPNPVLFNLSKKVSSQFKKYQHIVEVVPLDESARMISREHYQIYQKADFKMKTQDYF